MNMIFYVFLIFSSSFLFYTIDKANSNFSQLVKQIEKQEKEIAELKIEINLIKEK